jgi:hypothetical protein
MSSSSAEILETPSRAFPITPNSNKTRKLDHWPASTLSLDPLPYDELIQVAYRVARVFLSVNKWAHTLLPRGEPMWMSAMYTATIDFEAIPPPMRDSPIPRHQPKSWRIQTVLRVLILLNYKQHAQWYADSSRADKAAWLVELDSPYLLWINDKWETETLDTLRHAIRTNKSRDCGLWHQLQQFSNINGNDLLDTAIQNELFLLYFAVGQDQDSAHHDDYYEDLRRELLKLGVRDTPRVPLRKLEAMWFETKGDAGVKTAMEGVISVVQSAVEKYAVKYAAESSNVVGNDVW